MLRLPHIVPLLLVTLFLVTLPGCYLSNGAGTPPPDAGAADAHIAPPDAAPVLDAGAPTRDAGLLCRQLRADFLCLESFAAPAGRAFTLPLAFDVCTCCAEAECAVDVDRDARTLRVTTTLCPDACECDACNTPVASCEVPALAEGEWLVEVNGANAMVLPVDDEGSTASPSCVDFAEDDECTRGRDVLEGRPMRVARACVNAVVGASQRMELELVEDCGTCDRESTCEVRAEPRLTHDLPPGFDLHVRVGRYIGACDGICPPVCIENTRTCPLPALPPDQLHRVLIDGAPVLTFQPDAHEVVCSD